MSGGTIFGQNRRREGLAEGQGFRPQTLTFQHEKVIVNCRGLCPGALKYGDFPKSLLGLTTVLSDPKTQKD